MNVSRRCLLVATLALTAASPTLAQLPNKPNIVVMLMDNLGYGELGVYGGGILRGAPTPIIDNLASQGCASSISTSKRNVRRRAQHL